MIFIEYTGVACRMCGYTNRTMVTVARTDTNIYPLYILNRMDLTQGLCLHLLPPAAVRARTMCKRCCEYNYVCMYLCLCMYIVSICAVMSMCMFECVHVRVLC
jgi:hypothetical protein